MSQKEGYREEKERSAVKKIQDEIDNIFRADARAPH